MSRRFANRSGDDGAAEACKRHCGVNPQQAEARTASGLMRNLRAGANGRLFLALGSPDAPKQPIEAMAERNALFYKDAIPPVNTDAADHEVCARNR